MPENQKRPGQRPVQKRAAPRSRPPAYHQQPPSVRSGQPPRQQPGKKPRRKKRPAAQRPPEYAPHSRQRTARPASPDRRAAAIGEVHRRRRRRHKRNYTLYYILLFFFLSVTGVVLSLTVFFNIETIEISGREVYTSEDVLPLLDAGVGDNLLRINTGAMEEKLLECLPQADQVRVRRNFPSGLTVEITDGQPSAQLLYRENWYVISQSGRILQKNGAARSGCGVAVVGVSLENAQVGSYVQEVQQKNWEEAAALADAQGEDPPEQPHELTSLKALFNAMKAAEFSEINAVDISNEVALTIYWQNRIEIQLGSFSELEYKLRFVKEILTGEEYGEIIPADAAGVLDAQSASSVLPFQPAGEIEIPGGGVDEWNWDDGLPETEEVPSVPGEPDPQSSLPPENPDGEQSEENASGGEESLPDGEDST